MCRCSHLRQQACDCPQALRRAECIGCHGLQIRLLPIPLQREHLPAAEPIDGYDLLAAFLAQLVKRASRLPLRLLNVPLQVVGRVYACVDKLGSG